jgi:hypothetical protein
LFIAGTLLFDGTSGLMNWVHACETLVPFSTLNATRSKYSAVAAVTGSTVDMTVGTSIVL